MNINDCFVGQRVYVSSDSDGSDPLYIGLIESINYDEYMVDVQLPVPGSDQTDICDIDPGDLEPCEDQD